MSSSHIPKKSAVTGPTEFEQAVEDLASAIARLDALGLLRASAYADMALNALRDDFGNLQNEGMHQG